MNPIGLLLFVAFPGPAEDWSALPLPSLCAPPALHAHAPALWDGAHIRPFTPGTGNAQAGAGPRLPLATLTRMLEEDSRAHGDALEFFRGTPLLLARGSAAALARARALLADLERQSRALEIELVVHLRRSGGAGAPADGAGAGELALEETQRVVSGEEACFGARTSESFVESFEVEVAADSGVSRPELSLCLSGTTLHVWAARLGEGNSIFLGGLFDQSTLAERGGFDPDSRDLGKLEQPRLEVLQNAFAGVVESGKSLELELQSKAGAPRWTLSVEARANAATKPELADGWQLLDLAFLAHDARALPRLGPGALFGSEFQWNEEAPAGTALPASAVAASLDEGRSSSGSLSSSRLPPPLYWTDALLILPRGDAALLERARGLVRGAESLRSRTSRVELAQGGLVARFPVVSGFAARLLAGSERPYVVGYSTELAPQTWMPVPEVATAFDGLCVWLAAQDELASAAAWSTHSSPAREISSEDARLGRLQALSRQLASQSTLLHLGEPARELFAGADKLSLSLRVR